MKRLAFGTPFPGGEINWMVAALREIEMASAEDIEAVLADYSVTGTVTETRTLDVDTADIGDVVNLLATLISDIHKRGQKRSYAT